MPNYKLTYFNSMGRAELARLIFALKDIPFEDVRIEMEDWPKLKDTTPFGQLPILEIDGKVLAQSIAIATYLAKEHGLNGEDDWEAAKIQELFGATGDLVSHALPFYMEKDPEKKKKLMDAFEHEHLTYLFDKFEQILVEGGTGYFVGRHITVADLNMLCMVGLFGQFFPDTLEKHPALNAFKHKISNLPNIKKWIETRPKTEH